jgi:chemotaxis protein MotB
MPQYTAPEPIRPRLAIVRRHRGGAWKVAYADFVTAMMALFIVLWMMNSSKGVKDSVSGYFHDPKGYTSRRGAGQANSGEGLAVQTANVKRVREQIEQALLSVPEFQRMKDHVKLSVTGEGLRIDLLETEQGLFFVTGSPSPTDAGSRLLGALGAELKQMPNRIVIEGHTDARPFRNAAPSSGYGNWELSVDRANAARRLLHTFGIRSDQVVEVRGYADQKLLDSTDKNDPRNRRISLVVKL